MRLFKRKGDQRWRLALKDPRTGKWSERVLVRNRKEALTHAKRILLKAEADAAKAADPFAAWEKVPIKTHIDDFLEHVATKARAKKGRPLTERHLEDVRHKLEALAKAAKIRVVSDIDVDRITAVLADWREDSSLGKMGPGLSATSVGKYVGRIKAFERFLYERRRIRERKLENLPIPGKAPKRTRRALTADEQGRLIAAAERSKKRAGGLTGPERAEIYRVALGSGLRAGEIGQLRADDVRHDQINAIHFIRVRSEIAKNRSGAEIPLQRELGGFLLEKAGRLAPETTLYPGSWRDHAAAMVRRDSTAAGIPFEDPAAAVDFHSLRVSFVTNLAANGVGLAHAAKLARHHSPSLTLNTYTKPSLTELARAVGIVPAADIRGTHKRPSKGAI